MQIKTSSYANKNATKSTYICITGTFTYLHMYSFIISPLFNLTYFLFPGSVLNGPDPKNGPGKFNKRTHNITIC
jgi:hypothetical protein